MVGVVKRENLPQSWLGSNFHREEIVKQTFRVLALLRPFPVRLRRWRFECSPFIVIFRLDYEADVSSSGPSTFSLTNLLHYVIYQTQGKVFHQISKHWEVGWKARRKPSFLKQLQIFSNSWRSSPNFLIIRTTYHKPPHGSDFLLFTSSWIIYESKASLLLFFTQGQFIGVIGKVGSGKSSLLAAITAEMEKRLGEVH